MHDNNNNNKYNNWLRVETFNDRLKLLTYGKLIGMSD